MKKILFLLLFLFPFFTFASSSEEVQKVEIKLKTKTYNGLFLYTAIDKALDKRTKGDNNKKLVFYKKLLSQTEKSNKDIYKKLTIILKYGLNELEDFGNIENSNGVINQINENNYTQGNSIQNAIDSNQNSSISDGTSYYGNDGVVKGQGSFSDKEIEEAGQRVFDSKTEYEKQIVGVTFIGLVNDNLYNKDGIIMQLKYQENLINTKYRTEKFNLVTNDIIKDYNLYLSIFKDGGLVSNYDFLNGKGDLIEGYINMGDFVNNNQTGQAKILRQMGYKGVNGKIVYDEALNIFKNEIKDFEYLK